MSSYNTNLICNKFGGIRRKNASFSSSLITASDCQNVELYDTGINGGIGIRTAKGNKDILQGLLPETENIINIFESTQQNRKLFFIHTENETNGTLYFFNTTKNTVKALIENLNISGISTGTDFAQGNSDLFIFANNADNLYSIEIGNTEKIDEIVAVDREERPIKGIGTVLYDNRLWMFTANRLHYSVQGNVKDWRTSGADISTSAGFIEFSKNITAIGIYLNSIAVFFKDSSVVISGTYPYTESKESPGGCAGYKSLVFHGTDLYFYDDTKKGVFSFEQIVIGNQALGPNVAQEIQSELNTIDTTKLNNIQALSVVIADRNEIWFYFPTTNESDYSQVMIYDYARGEWVKRKCPKINCIEVFDNQLYSAGKNKIYREYIEDTFNGEYIQHFYKCSNCNLGSDTTLKVSIFSPRITVDSPYINELFVKYIKNYNFLKRPKIKKLKSKYKKFLIYGESLWGEGFWCSENINALLKIPNTTFKTLQITFYTENDKQDFSIRNIEFSKIKVIQV